MYNDRPQLVVCRIFFITSSNYVTVERDVDKDGATCDEAAVAFK